MRIVIKAFFKFMAICLVVCCLTTIESKAQTIGGLVVYPEGVEALQDNPTNFDDPVVNGNGINIPGAAETENNFTISDKDFQYGVSAEAGFSAMSKYLNIPLSIGYKGFSLTVAIPFYIQKKAKYSHGYVAAYGGLGDISAEVSYKYQSQKFFEAVSVTSSFPTGNKNRTVKGYIVPMGTGSFDFIFSNTFQYRHAYFRVYNNLSYRLSGKCKRDITYNIPDAYQDADGVLRSGNEMVHYVTSNGNFLSCNSSFDYPVLSWMSLHAGFAVMNSSAGTLYYKRTKSWNDDVFEYPTSKSNQAYTSIDVRAAIAFSYWGIDLMCVFAQPVYVKTENPNIKDSQKFNFYIKLSKKIF
ncbi:MAG: hypothetical protein J6T63_01405 [Bacteroidales bacterium]|jgi:hypothetical protein|nr:hypothetical protein [Bacteroidales bacterium]